MFITIDINGDNIYIAEGNATMGGVEAHKCDEVKLPAGTIEDGDIKNQSAFITSLTKLLNEHSFKSTSVVATFTSNLVISRRLNLPPGKSSEIAGMVKSQMSQAVSDLADCVFEYTYAKPVQAKNPTADIWAYALDKEIVDRYYSAIKSVRLRPTFLDIHSNCIQKLISGSQINGKSLNGISTLFVDVERDFVEIHLFNGYSREFSRIAPVSASDFLLLASKLGYGRQNTLSLMEKRLLAMSEDHGQKYQAETVSPDLIDMTPDTLSRDAVFADAVHQYTGRVSDELLKMVQFQMMRDSSTPVSCIYLYGGLSVINGLDSSLSQTISCPVEVVKTISKIKIDQKVALPKYLNAIGALIRLK